MPRISGRARSDARSLRLDDFVPYRLAVTANQTAELISGAYRRLFGLSIPQWRVLSILGERDVCAQAELVPATRMDKLTISRAVRALELRALVSRAEQARDRRTRMLALTSAGRRLYARIVPTALMLERRLLDGLRPREIAALMSMLRRLETSAASLAAEHAGAALRARRRASRD